METLVKSSLNDFFCGRRCLITGHTGFKGSWLTTWLDMLGAKIFGFALAPDTIPSVFEILSLENIVEQAIADIRDYNSILAFVKECRPEIVFHMAAQPLVCRSYNEPKLTYDTNVGGTTNLIEALRIVDCAKVIIIVTTDKVYENRENLDGYRESDRLGGYDPYSSSKACTELVAKSYYDAFLEPKGKTFLSTARSGNVIGGGDWSKDRIVPDCVRALTNGQEIPVRSPSSVRPWQHVLEPLFGYLILAAQMWSGGQKFSASWNFGPNYQDTCTVQELVELIISAWGSGSWKDISSENQVHETQLLKLNSEKARSYLSWRSFYNYIDAIKETIAWYRYYYSSGKHMLNFTRKQIRNYEYRHLKRNT
ncbi:MAG: CDP-glucose 4,6-dehydratase [Deltaproteobacteria bacterium]|nr:CDP-glucose 4,6-dehydratase [Deltaproteobacteria bacterium]